MVTLGREVKLFYWFSIHCTQWRFGCFPLFFLTTLLHQCLFLGVSLIAACVMLYKLALIEFAKRTAALASVKLLLIFPLSFFYFTPCTESLFLCLFSVLAVTFILPVSYSIYSIVFLIISYSPSWLLSGPRYLAVVFPMYLVLAKLLEKRPVMARGLEMFFILFMALMIVAFMHNKVF